MDICKQIIKAVKNNDLLNFKKIQCYKTMFFCDI